METIDTDRLMGTEEAMAKAITEMMELNKEKVKILTDLDAQEVGILSILDTVGTHCDISTLKYFIDTYCRFKVSKDRLGRKELAGMVAMAGFNVDTTRKQGGWRNLLSGFGR